MRLTKKSDEAIHTGIEYIAIGCLFVYATSNPSRLYIRTSDGAIAIDTGQKFLSKEFRGRYFHKVEVINIDYKVIE